MSQPGSAAKTEKRERSRTSRRVFVFMCVAVCLLVATFALSQMLKTDEPSPVSMACATNLYSSYDPKKLDQCMAVCIACNAGVKTTCSTSCKLRGAR